MVRQIEPTAAMKMGTVTEAELQHVRREIADLRSGNQRLVEAVAVLLRAMETWPTEEPVDAIRRRERGIRRARELLYVARLESRTAH